MTLAERDGRRAGARRPPDRTRRLVSGVVTALASRAAGFLTPILTVPVTLPFFGKDLYGLWAAVTAVSAMTAFADLGLGSGLMTKLAPCYAHGDTVRARRYISSAYLTLTLLAATLTGLLWLLADRIPWVGIFNVTGQITAEQTRLIALIGLTAFTLNVPLSLIVRVQYAYQQVSWSNLWQTGGNLVGVATVLGLVSAGLSPIVVIAASAAAPLLVNLVNTVWFFGRQSPQLRPRVAAVEAVTARELVRLGGRFFLVTVVMTAATNADTLIIAHTLGLSSVAAFAVSAKLLAQVGLVAALVNVPLWPANGDALAQRQFDWVQRITRRMTVVSVLAAGLPAAAFVLLGDRLFAVWLPVSVDGDPWLLAGLGAWWVLQAGLSPRFMVQNAGGVIGPQLIGWTVFLALSTVGKWYGAERFGVDAVAWAGAACYALTVVPAALYGYHRTLRRHRRRVPEEGSGEQLVAA